MRVLSDQGKLAIAQWYAAAAANPCGDGLKRLYARTQRLVAILPGTTSSASIMLDPGLTSSGKVETMTLRMAEHADWVFEASDRDRLRQAIAGMPSRVAQPA